MLRSIHISLILVLISVPVIACQIAKKDTSMDIKHRGDASVHARSYYYFMASQQKLRQGDINEAIWLLDQAIDKDNDSIYLKLEMANLLLIKKEITRSLELVNEVLEKEPFHNRALRIAGQIYQKLNQIDKAFEAYEKVLKNQPEDQGIYLLLGRLYWNKNQFSDAERVFEKMTINIPDSFVAYYFYAKALATQGKEKKAEIALLECLKLEPSLEEPKLELLKIYRLNGDQQKITGIYKSILNYDPNNHKIALELAEHYHKMNRTPLSSSLLAELGKRSTKDTSIANTVFENYIKPKRYAEALRILNGMLKTASDQSDLNYLAGVAYRGIEQDEKALGGFLKVKPLTRFYSNAVVHSAFIFHDAGKIDRAVEVIHKAISHEPDNANYYLYLGAFYEELERYDDALRALHEGVKRDNKNERLHFRIGVVYDKMGQKDKSIAQMKNVLKLTPNDAEALNYLGYTYADMGINLDEAEILIQSALKIKPNDGYITDSLGWVFYKRGNYNQALKLLNKAVKIIPDDPIILEHLGDVYHKLDMKEKALNYYRQSLKKKPKGRDALQKKIRTLTHP